SFSLRFRRKERLEYAALGRFVHPFPGICNGKSDVRGSRFLPVPGLDSQPALVRHGVSGLAGEVEYDLLQLMWFGLDRAQSRREFQRQYYLLVENAANHVLHAPDESIQVQRLRGKGLFPAKRQKLTHQRCRAIRRVPYLVDFVSYLTRRRAFEPLCV